jgi:hypothetical protein
MPAITLKGRLEALITIIAISFVIVIGYFFNDIGKRLPLPDLLSHFETAPTAATGSARGLFFGDLPLWGPLLPRDNENICYSFSSGQQAVRSIRGQRQFLSCGDARRKGGAYMALHSYKTVFVVYGHTNGIPRLYGVFESKKQALKNLAESIVGYERPNFFSLDTAEFMEKVKELDPAFNCRNYISKDGKAQFSLTWMDMKEIAETEKVCPTWMDMKEIAETEEVCKATGASGTVYKATPLLKAFKEIALGSGAAELTERQAWDVANGLIHSDGLWEDINLRIKELAGELS